MPRRMKSSTRLNKRDLTMQLGPLQESNGRAPHGTSARYCGGCRCDLCKTGRAEFMRAYRTRGIEAAVKIERKGKPLEICGRLYLRTCPGPSATMSCVGRGGLGSPLRKSSKGGLCRTCRRMIPGVWNGYVDAAAVRAHLEVLRALGFGCVVVGRATDVSPQTMLRVSSGQQTLLRAKSATAILAVTTKSALAASSYATKHRSRDLLRQIRAFGLTTAEIAARLGSAYHKIPVLRGRYVERRTELRLEWLLADIRRENVTDTTCSECGLSHERPDRLRRLARMLPSGLKEICEAYPCTYPFDRRGDMDEAPRMLYRDLHDIGARPPDRMCGDWDVPRGSVVRLVSSGEAMA